MQPLCSLNQQPHTLKKQKYPADGDVLQDTLIQKMLT